MPAPPTISKQTKQSIIKNFNSLFTMSNPRISSPPTVSSPLRNPASKRSSYTIPSPTNDTPETQKLTKRAKLFKKLGFGKDETGKKKHHRHSYDYQSLISGDETDLSEVEGGDEEYVRLLKSMVKKLPKLNEEEQKFFDLVSKGNVSAVGDFYNASPTGCDLIKALNFEGNTVLHIAVGRQDEEMINLLCGTFGHCISPAVLRDVLLHAIKEENVGIVNQLLDVINARGISPVNVQQRKMSSSLANYTYANTAPLPYDSADERFLNSYFTDDITPFILAAQGKNYKLMEIFYDIGHRLVIPDDEFCECKDCQNISPIANAIKKLNEHRAIANPHYICFITFREYHRDPLHDVFQMILKLENCINQVKYFREDYENILKNLKEFSCDLLTQCQDLEEIHLFLKQSAGYKGTGDDYPRLAWALAIRQKEFIAHPHCQMVLFNEWIKGWESWREKSTLERTLHGASRLILWPFLAIIGLFYQGGFFGAPVNRFLNALASYIFFLAMVLYIATYNRATGDRGPPKTYFEIPVMIWVVGHIMSIVLDSKRQAVFRSVWTWYNIVTQLMFILAFIFWLVALIEEHSKVNIPRKHWSETEPILFAEIFFALASVMSYSRVVRLLQLDFRIGPLITAMGQMGRDIIDVLIFLAFIMLGFAAGMYYMYRTYHGWTDTDKEGHALTQKDEFTEFDSALETLYYALLGADSLDNVNIIPRTIHDPNNSSTTAQNQHVFKQSMGRVMLAVFHLIGTLMAMNLVTSLVISHYDRVRGNVDVEWKFVRGQIWYSYISGNVAPSPFSILPTLPCLKSLCAGVKNKKLGKKNIDGDAEDPFKKSYSQRTRNIHALTKQIIQRYIRDKAEIEEAEKAKTETMTSLREELSELREAMEKSERVLMNHLTHPIVPGLLGLEENKTTASYPFSSSEAEDPSPTPKPYAGTSQRAFGSPSAVVPNVSSPDSKNARIIQSENLVSPVKKHSSPIIGVTRQSSTGFGSPSKTLVTTSPGKPPFPPKSPGKSPPKPTTGPPSIPRPPAPPVPALPSESASSNVAQSVQRSPPRSQQQLGQPQNGQNNMSSDISSAPDRRRASDLTRNARFQPNLFSPKKPNK